MNTGNILQTGQWLKFKAGTCFGNTKDHFGILVAIDNELSICVAINGTSNVQGAVEFALNRGIMSAETVVVIDSKDPESAFHFGKKTAFDCNRPAFVETEALLEWAGNGMIEKSSFNPDVDKDLLSKIRNGIIESPLVPEKYKKIIQNNTL